MTDRLLTPEENRPLRELIATQGRYFAELILSAQDAKTLREAGEWLDTKWVSYGTFAFIKLSDEEMKALRQGKLGG